jgi:hypothetical protein
MTLERKNPDRATEPAPASGLPEWEKYYELPEEYSCPALKIK